MARPQTIDRTALLAAAERVVEKVGVANLTLEAVAAEAEISKGGLLYCYRSKSALIAAMVQRDIESFEMAVEQLRSKMKGSPNDAVLAHIRTTGLESLDSSTKAMSMLATLVESPEHLQSVRDFYDRALHSIDVSTEAGRRARLAFFAVEGAVLLRAFNFTSLSREAVEDMMNDAWKLADTES